MCCFGNFSKLQTALGRRRWKNILRSGYGLAVEYLDLVTLVSLGVTVSWEGYES